MALNKIYDTPFERLCLEYTPDFSTEEPRKWLEETYNRKGYLNIGDEFIYYNENNGIEKLIRGKVVDKDKYVINRMGYKFNNICLTIFCRERDTKRALEINEEQLAKAKMLGSTLFNKNIKLSVTSLGLATFGFPIEKSKTLSLPIIFFLFLPYSNNCLIAEGCFPSISMSLLFIIFTLIIYSFTKHIYYHIKISQENKEKLISFL